MYITNSILFYFSGMEKWRFEGAWGGWRWGWGVWICFLVKFSLKPKIQTVFIPMYTRFCFLFFFPKDRGEEKCAKVPCSHWEENVKWKCYLKKKKKKSMTSLIFIHAFKWKCFVFYLSHSQRMVALSFYTSAFWLFSSSFFSSSEEPFSFSPVFQLPCLFRVKKALPHMLIILPFTVICI